MNKLLRWNIQLQRAGIPMPDISPADAPGSKWGKTEFLRILESYIDFDAIPDLLDGTEPALFISAIDVCAGTFEIFREDDLSAAAILASAAEPHLFEAVEIDGKHYWDGLFSKNPPVRDFSTLKDIPDPDEVWLLQINPSTRSKVPRSQAEIEDRRNELSGNTSLEQEVQFIEQVNEWVDAGYLPDRYTHTDIRRVRFD
jgi:NTE family protein